jgi:hypothetical protein
MARGANDLRAVAVLRPAHRVDHGRNLLHVSVLRTEVYRSHAFSNCSCGMPVMFDTISGV